MADGFSGQIGVKEGDLLAGKYRIDKILGAGGMGVVVAAHHVHLDERVAIKFLLPEAVSNHEAVGRFAREARVAVKIKSEHVVRVSDVGTLESGAPYMVMEFLEGGDLEAWLRQKGPLPVDQAVEFVLQACEAVAEAHSLGIVHRDLKPANLFVVRRPDGTLSVKVLDFGISKIRLGGSGPDLGMTKTTAVMGSPLYMSPEQLQSAKDVDARGDIWALGVILYELLTGTMAFEAETMPELIVKILQESPVPLRNKRPDAPPGLDEVILKCLEKDRGKRYRTVGELARDLLMFAPRRSRASVERISGVLQAAGLSQSALELPPSSEQAQRPAGNTMAAWGQTSTNPLGRRGTLWGVTGVGAAVAVVALVVLISGRSGGPSQDGTPAPSSPTAAAAPVPIEPSKDVFAPKAPLTETAAPKETTPEETRPVPPVVAPAPSSTPVKVATARAPKTPVKPRATATPSLPTKKTTAASKPTAAPRYNAFDDRK